MHPDEFQGSLAATLESIHHCQNGQFPGFSLEQQLTNLTPGFDIRDFDISPDGREVVLERVQEHSDVVLLEIPRP